MARANPDDIAACVRGALGDCFGVLEPCLRVLCAVADHTNNGSHLDALAKLGIDVDRWVDDDLEVNCAEALELYAKRYPEG